MIQKKKKDTSNSEIPSTSRHEVIGDSHETKWRKEKQERQTPPDRPASVSSSETSCSCDDHSSLSHASDTYHHSPSLTRLTRETSPPPNQSKDFSEHHSSRTRRHGDRSNRTEGRGEDRERTRDSEESAVKKQTTDSCDTTKRKRKREESSPSSHKKSKSGQDSSKTSRLRTKDYPSLLEYFLRDAVYFVMKSNNHENVDIAKNQGVWSTPPQNEHKLNRAFSDFRNVILIFSVKESGRFQGIARLSSELLTDQEPVQWLLPPSLKDKKLFNGLFKVDWISKKDLPFTRTTHLFNPLNDGKPVKIARDGQEIDPRVGCELVKLFPQDEDVDIIPLLKRMKKQTKDRPSKASTSSLHLPSSFSRHETTLSSSSSSTRRHVRQRLNLPSKGANFRVVVYNHPMTAGALHESTETDRIASSRNGDSREKRHSLQSKHGSSRPDARGNFLTDLFSFRFL